MSSLNQQSIGKYQILERLGQGGMAEVYKALDSGLNRHVAIKICPPIQDLRNLAARFRREARAVGSLKHPHIVQVYDFDVTDNMHYLVMELISGPTLEQKIQEYVASNQTFTLLDATRIFAQLAEAVDYAHGQGIIHRDLKPSNIMFRDNGQVVLTDFGLARLTNSTNYTQSSQLIGTFRYMSPEQCRGEPANACSDIYALGVILYEMLTGQTPFAALEPHVLLYHHIHQAPQPPTLYNPNIPLFAESVILKALAKTPQERFQTAKDMVRALSERPEPAPQSAGERVKERASPTILLPEATIPAALWQKLRETLTQCTPFDSNQALRAVFADPRLFSWHNKLPEANNLKRRVDKCIDFLFEKQNRNGENALILLLRVLQDRKDLQDQLWHDLEEVAVGLERSLNRGQPSSVENLATLSQAVVTLYKHGDYILGKPPELFGRQELLETVETLLNDKRSVLLHGLGGSGKTALAATAAELWLQQDSSRQAIWAQCGAASAEALIEALVENLVGDQRERQAFRQAVGRNRLKMVSDLLVSREPILIVLDDVWHENALTLLRGVNRTAVIATSRRRMSGPARLLEITELPPAAGLKFLAHSAGLEGLSQDLYAKKLCQKLSYHAYALEIAGNIIKVDSLSPQNLLEQIEERPHDLPMPPGFVEEGRESVAVLLEASFNSLTPAAQTVFLAFGDLFAPTATLDLLEGFVMDTGLNLSAAVLELSRHSLIRRLSDDQYSLHDLTFYYAREKSRQIKGDNQDARLKIIQQYVKKQIDDLDRLELNITNILIAAQRADADLCLQIMEALTMRGYLDEKGHTIQYLVVLDRAIKQLQSKKETQQLAPEQTKLLRNLLGKRGNAHFDRGDYHSATNAYKTCLDLTDESHLKSRLLGLLGKTISFEIGPEQAQEYFQQAYQIADELNDDAVRGIVLSQEAHAAGHLQDYEAAHRIAARQVEINEKLWQERQDEPTLRELFNALINFGGAELDLAKTFSNSNQQMAELRINHALSINRRARGIARKLGDTGRRATAAWALAEAYDAKGKRRRVRELTQMALNLWHSIGVTRQDKIIAQFLKERGYKIID